MRGLPAVRLRHPEHGEVEEEDIGAVAESLEEDPWFAKTREMVIGGPSVRTPEICSGGGLKQEMQKSSCSSSGSGSGGVLKQEMQKSSGSSSGSGSGSGSVVTVHRNEGKRKPLNSDDDAPVHRTLKKCQSSGGVLEQEM